MEKISNIKIENFHHDINNIPWSKLDKGIAPVVKILNAAGYPTMSSCDGHLEDFAWITTPWIEDPREIAIVLHKNGIRGFTINHRYEFISLKRCIRFIRIEFWNIEGYPKK